MGKTTIHRLLESGKAKKEIKDLFYLDCERKVCYNIYEKYKKAKPIHLTLEDAIRELTMAGIDPRQIDVQPDNQQSRYLTMSVQMPNTTIQIKLPKSNTPAKIKLSPASPWWHFTPKRGKLARFIITGNKMFPKIRQQWEALMFCTGLKVETDTEMYCRSLKRYCGD